LKTSYWYEKNHKEWLVFFLFKESTVNPVVGMLDVEIRHVDGVHRGLRGSSNVNNTIARLVGTPVRLEQPTLQPKLYRHF
jgi:hypothetical protein